VRTGDLRIKRASGKNTNEHGSGKHAGSCAPDCTEQHGGPDANADLGHNSEAIESASEQSEGVSSSTLERLGRALEAAALAGQWEVVRRLTDAMERLQGVARAEPRVVELDAFRGKRGGQ
jgi:hypothetical protein